MLLFSHDGKQTCDATIESDVKLIVGGFMKAANDD